MMPTPPKTTAAPKRQPRQDRDAAAPDNTTPAPVGAGSDYTQFVWQQLTQLGDIKQTLGSLTKAIEHLEESTTSTKSKVQELADLKNKLIGGFIVLGAVFTICSGLVVWSANKIWDTVSVIAKPAMEQALLNQKLSTPPPTPSPPKQP